MTTRRPFGPAPSIRAWCDEWLRERTVLRGDAAGTIGQRETFCRQLCKWHEANLYDPRELESERIIDFFALTYGSATWATFNCKVAMWNGFAAYVQRKCYVPADRPLVGAVSTQKGMRREFTIVSPRVLAEIIARGETPWERAIMACLGYGLFRKHSLRALQWRHIDFDRGIVTVYNQKGKKPQHNTISPLFMRELRRWKAAYPRPSGTKPDGTKWEDWSNDWFVIPSRRRAGTTGGYIWRPDLSPADITPLLHPYTDPHIPEGERDGDGGAHFFRRSGAQAVAESFTRVVNGREETDLMRGIRTVQAMLGHEKPETTMVYLRTSYLELEAQQSMQGKDFLPDLEGVTHLDAHRHAG